ncbi:MAG: hypothetical protein CMO74_04330 [Verrucomicrobiales bacterium]|nr:hypothetical protein [Verrucomicrobiales bacterium]|tara:strand:+ start:416 stop:619 length:204 start_codon:yes stop_codon:yes gene_type:complete
MNGFGRPIFVLELPTLRPDRKTFDPDRKTFGRERKTFGSMPGNKSFLFQKSLFFRGFLFSIKKLKIF